MHLNKWNVDNVFDLFLNVWLSHHMTKSNTLNNQALDDCPWSLINKIIKLQRV